MRRRITKTAIGKRLQARRNKITPKSQRGLTEGQIRYRKDKKKRDAFWAHENDLARKVRY